MLGKSVKSARFSLVGSMRQINLSHCVGLSTLPDLTPFTRLKVIVLDGCYGMKVRNGSNMLALTNKARSKLPPLLRWDYAE